MATGDEAPMVIVITPQWRPSRARDLPATVKVLTQQELDAFGSADTMDLQHQVPGFAVKNNAMLGQPYLRGVGSDLITAGADASVATFVDGIYQPRATDAIQDFYDVNRVEVLKGPQAVHLGRNAMGGAVSIITRDPVPFATASADLLLGSYDQRRLRAMLNLPLAGKRAAVRVAGLVSRRDGYVDNVLLDEALDDEDVRSGRAKLLLAPRDHLELVVSAEAGQRDDSRGMANYPEADQKKGINGGVALGGRVPDDPREVSHNLGNFAHIDTRRYGARLTWALAGAELRALSAWQETETSAALDIDGTDVDFSTNHLSEHSRSFSQELRLTSTTAGPLSWVTGLYYLKEDARQVLDIRLPLFAVRSRPDGRVRTEAWALFGQASYTPAPRWRLTAGLRYSRDRRSIHLVHTLDDPFGANGPAGTFTFTQDDTESWGAATPELALAYTPAAATTWFARAARGFKAGGFNSNAVQSAFDPEKLWSYEAGVKHAWNGGSLTAALFHYEYRDLQLLTLPPTAPLGTFPSVTNAAAATIDGLDLSLGLTVTPRLSISLSLGLLDARFDDFVSTDPNRPTLDPDRAGGRLPQAPDASLTLGAGYHRAVAGHGHLALRGFYSYRSRVYFNAFQDPAVSQDGYGLVNASLSWAPLKDDWYLEFYGHNLANELYAENVIRQDPFSGTFYYWGAPRTFGVRLGYRL